MGGEGKERGKESRKEEGVWRAVVRVVRRLEIQADSRKEVGEVENGGGGGEDTGSRGKLEQRNSCIEKGREGLT